MAGDTKFTIQPPGYAGYFLDLELVELGEVVVRDGHSWHYYSKPTAILLARRPDEVDAVLEMADAHVQKAKWAAGFVGYEAGHALNQTIVSKEDSRPLAWFALFDEPPQRYRELLPVYESPSISLEPPGLDEESYQRQFELVKAALGRGESYQINLTMRQRFRLEASPAAFFSNRCGVMPPPYATYINGGGWVVASFSPELFFERNRSELSSKPMKGTVSRPRSKAEEIAAARVLANDPKSMAENIMIVDMVRNDFGSVAEIGSVRAPRLLHVERHRDLLQMTSTVTARTAVSTPELFRRLFPPASITGAPKVSTCRLISELEETPRGIYCGAIGFMSPGRQRFNVAIRTAWIDQETGQGEFGIGSGLVWDSEPDQEYAECLAKRDFLINSGHHWALVEALPGHELRDESVLDQHLGRLALAAEEFNILVDWKAIRLALAELPQTLPADRVKVRLAVQLDGKFSIELGPSAVSGASLTATVASWPVDSLDFNLRLKSVSRGVYDEHLDDHPEVDEVLLYNERGELTEFCRGNVVLRIDSQLVTPDPVVGCLAGVGVKRMIDAGKVAYSRLTPEDLEICEEVFFVNSVSGLVPVHMA